MATSISLKLLINKKTRKVLFAEASNDFIDLLFSVLTLPIGSVVRHMTHQSMVGSIGKIYQSVVNMEATCMTTANKDKSALLHPIPTSHNVSDFMLLDNLVDEDDEDDDYVNDEEESSDDDEGDNFVSVGGGGDDSLSEKFYSCRKNHLYCMSDYFGYICPYCPNGTLLKTVFKFIKDADPKASTLVGGYVKCDLYMVTDDLTVTLMFPISTIALLQKFDVENIGDLEEKEVRLGQEVGLALLRASFESKTALTDVFLGKGIKT